MLTGIGSADHMAVRTWPAFVFLALLLLVPQTAAAAADPGTLSVRLHAKRDVRVLVEARVGSISIASQTARVSRKARNVRLRLNGRGRSAARACRSSVVAVRATAGRRVVARTRTRIGARCSAATGGGPTVPGFTTDSAAPAPQPTAGPAQPTSTTPSPVALAEPLIEQRGPLAWRPPALDNTTTVKLGTGFTLSELDPTRDYIIELPDQLKTGGTVIKGGHNVVIKGGWITIPTGTNYDSERRGIYIKDSTGTVHIEGVRIDGSGGGVGDGIAIAAPEAIVQVENTRITGLHGSYAGFHADVIQPWGGVKELRVDHLTGSSNYQGLQLAQDQGPIGRVDLRNVNLSYTGESPNDGGYLLWLTKGDQSCESYPVSISNVYVAPKAGRWLADSVWPGVWSSLPCKGVQVGAGALAQVSWPTLPALGSVFRGPPATGDYVTADASGVGYVTAGYAAE